jgi:hypothetical protein
MLDRSIARPFFSRNQRIRTDDSIDFKSFSNYFYPHFRREASRLGDTAMIYTEITTHIKGSLAALRTPNGYLNREQYITLG